MSRNPHYEKDRLPEWLIFREPVLIPIYTITEHGEIIVTTEAKYVPAALPMNGIFLKEPIRVQALRTKGPVKGGSIQHIDVVTSEGKVRIIGDRANLYDMGMFVELLLDEVSAANDNKPKK